MPRGINICKKIIHNPIFVALLLTVLVIIVIVAIYNVQKFGGAELFKCSFYIFVLFLIIIFIHDFLLKKSIKATHVNKDVKEVFTGIDLSKEMSHDVIQVEPISYDNFKNNNYSDINYSDNFKNRDFRGGDDNNRNKDDNNRNKDDNNRNKDDNNKNDESSDGSSDESSDESSDDESSNENDKYGSEKHKELNILDSLVEIDIKPSL